MGDGPADQGRLPFAEDEASGTGGPPDATPAGRVVRVLPDVAAIDRAFDYVVPESWAADGRGERLQVGSRVRVVLAGRRVGGWVVADHVTPPAGVELRPLAKLSGHGPSAEVLDLARWAAHRWAGRLQHVLTSASPPTNVDHLPAPPRPVPVPSSVTTWAVRALEYPRTVVRLPPDADVVPLILEGARRGDTLVVVPTTAMARRLALRVRRTGLPVALLPDGWARAAAGGIVIGARTAALGPVADLAAVIVVDEHDESHREGRSPTWHARDVAAERARRAGVTCVLTSSTPTLEALAWGELLVPSRSDERAGWPVVDLVDRRSDDPVRGGLFSDPLVPVIRGEQGDPVVCVLNRKGRSRLLACRECGELARCDEHQVPLAQAEDDVFTCPVDGALRPVVCPACGSMAFKNLRAGVARVREELEALAGRPAVEVTADTSARDIDGAALLVGTEAVLHRVDRAARVVFLEFDQELLAPRTRAAEQAMALLVRAARLLGCRADGGRLVVQTRQPDHEVLQAALHADPGRLVAEESARRRVLDLPPFSALAQVSGPEAAEFVRRLGRPSGIDVLGPRDGAWLVRAPDPGRLADVLAAVERPAGRLRIEVDPHRS